MTELALDVDLKAEMKTASTPAVKALNLDDRREEVAKKLGVEKTSVRSVTMQLEILRKQGILVDLSIGGTSMFTRSTSWVEIGIQPEEDDVRTQRFTRGRKYLIPEDQVKKLHSVETSQYAEHAGLLRTGHNRFSSVSMDTIHGIRGVASALE